LHNLHYYQELMRDLRKAIEEKTLAETSERLLRDRKQL
jgi:tRNA-guanine family transglycosylase